MGHKQSRFRAEASRMSVEEIHRTFHRLEELSTLRRRGFRLSPAEKTEFDHLHKLVFLLPSTAPPDQLVYDPVQMILTVQ